MKKHFIFINTLLFVFVNIIFSQTPDAEVIKYHTNVTCSKTTLTENTTIEIQVNNRDGEEFTNVSIPYSKMNKISKLEACIKDMNNKVIKKLKASDVKEHSDFEDYSFYSDNMVKEFTLKNNLYPYIFSYSYQLESNEFLGIEMWIPTIEREVPTRNASLTIEVPSNYPISYRNYGTTEVKKDTLFTTDIRYSWQAKYIPIGKNEIYMPDIIEFYPRVEVVPVNFSYVKKGSFSDWISYGNWQYSLIENLSDLPISEQEKIKSMIAGVTDKREQIKILYHYLQDETRYVNISIKTGGMKPFPASFVSENKYGDCKALSNYMKSMLSVIGIPSFYTKVYADDKIKTLDKSFPSQQFNHIILNVPLGNDTIWLDCTSNGPFNYLGTFTQNRDVFIIDKNKSYLTRTPALTLKDVIDIRKVEFSENSNSETLAHFNNTYRSDDFMYLATLAKSANESKKTQIIHNNYIEKGFDPLDYKLVESPRDSAYIQLSYNATTSKIYNQYGNEKIIHLLKFDIPEFKKPALRKHPVQIDYPVYKSDTLNYKIPEGYIIFNKPNPVSVTSEYGKYVMQFQQDASKIRVIKSFILNAGNYTLNQYPGFYDFIKKITDLENNTMIITVKQ
jgi:hypothetical protein